MIPLVLTEDGSGHVVQCGTRQPSLMDYFKLVAHTGVTLTVPTGAKHVFMSPALAVDVFIKYTGDIMTSAVYAATSADTHQATRTAGCGFEQISGTVPAIRSLVGVTQLSVISPDGGDLTLSWFG